MCPRQWYNEPMTRHKIGSGSYRPRRVRSGDPPPFQMTGRDIEIIRLVARYRFLSSHHIRCLVSGSGKHIGTRLKGLFEHGYLDRPQCQYDAYRPGGGSEAIAYGLADRGAYLLSQRGELSQGERVSWANKNRQVGRPFLEHTLAIADLAVALNTAVRAREDVELIDGEALLELLPSGTALLHKPYRLSVPVTHRSMRREVGVEPDYAFSLAFPTHRRRAFFLGEVDRGTMPVERYDLKQTSILRKLLAYQTLWKAKRHQSHFGWNNFRVLFITTSNERVENMRAALRGHALLKGSPLFLFADKKALSCGDIFSADWQDGEGATHRLIPGK